MHGTHLSTLGSQLDHTLPFPRGRYQALPLLPKSFLKYNTDGSNIIGAEAILANFAVNGEAVNGEASLSVGAS